jgi:hypothetical protein
MVQRPARKLPLNASSLGGVTNALHELLSVLVPTATKLKFEQPQTATICVHSVG